MPHEQEAEEEKAALAIQGACETPRRSHALGPIGRFWDGLAFSRIVEWGRDWNNLMNPFEQNRFEALGMPRDTLDARFGMEPGTFETRRTGSYRAHSLTPAAPRH